MSQFAIKLFQLAPSWLLSLERPRTMTLLYSENFLTYLFMDFFKLCTWTRVKWKVQPFFQTKFQPNSVKPGFHFNFISLSALCCSLWFLLLIFFARSDFTADWFQLLDMFLLVIIPYCSFWFLECVPTGTHVARFGFNAQCKSKWKIKSRKSSNGNQA